MINVAGLKGEGGPSAPTASKKKKPEKVKKKSTDLEPDLGLQKQDSKCLKFWKLIFCVASWNKCFPKKQRARQAKRGVALFCLVMYSFDVGSDLGVGFDLLNRCHEITGKTIVFPRIVSSLE